MEAILLVGHGSRDSEGNEELLKFADMVRKEAPGFVIEACFLELAEPDIEQGIERCIGLGATRVVLVPVILFAAGHAKIHIPLEIDKARARYPGVQFAYGRPLGIHQKVMEILKSRLAEAGFQLHGESAVGAEDGGAADIQGHSGEMPHGGADILSREPDTAILLLGRGSSDGDANGDFLKTARLVWEQVPVKWVESCFIGVTEPTYPEGLERCLRLGAKTIYVLPYFLFTGILIKRIERMTADFADLHPDVRVELAGYFGFHPQLVELLLERVAEAVNGEAAANCDMCKYRLGAAIDHDHHHHHDHEHDEHGHHDHEHHDHDEHGYLDHEHAGRHLV